MGNGNEHNLNDVAEKDRGDPEVDAAVESTAVSIEDAIKLAEAANDNVEIAGVKFDNSTTVYLNLKAAVEVAQNEFPNLDIGRIYIQKFTKGVSGESRSDGTYIDAAEADNLAHLISTLLHEAGHQEGRLGSEPVIEAGAQARAARLGYSYTPTLSAEYQRDLDMYRDWLGDVKGEETVAEAALRVYDLYDKGKYEAIYEMHEKALMKGKNEAEQIELLKNFRKIFPDLDWQVDGKFHLVNVEKMKSVEEDDGEKIVEMAKDNVEERAEKLDEAA